MTFAGAQTRVFSADRGTNRRETRKSLNLGQLRTSGQREALTNCWGICAENGFGSVGQNPGGCVVLPNPKDEFSIRISTHLGLCR